MELKYSTAWVDGSMMMTYSSQLTLPSPWKVACTWTRLPRPSRIKSEEQRGCARQDRGTWNHAAWRQDGGWS